MARMGVARGAVAPYDGLTGRTLTRPRRPRPVIG